MNINFGDEGLIVDNLQIFLKENECPSLCLSGIYDTATHRSLIRYLKKPNTADVYKVRNEIHNNFIYRDENPPHKLIDGGGIINFDNKSTPGEIIYRTKPTNAYYSGGIKFISEHIEELSAFVEKLGWSVTSYSTFGTGTTTNNRTAAEIRISKTGIRNRFPNSDILPMINLFEGKYIYNKSFTSDSTFDNYMTTNKNYKVAAIPCKPGDSFTIAHGYSTSCEVAVAYSNQTLNNIKSEGSYVEGVESRMRKDAQGSLNVGEFFIYEIPQDSEARYLLVQMPYRDDLTSFQTQKISIQLGDVNQDGKIDYTDVAILDTWVSEKENNLTHSVELSETALIAANVTQDMDLDGNPLVDRNDVTTLKAYIDNGKTELLGTIEYEQNIRVSSTESDRLLIMYGYDASESSLNIPIDEYYVSPWAIHSKFLEYFLDRVIHPYSDILDITWLQANIKLITDKYNDRFTGKYDQISDYSTTDFIKYDTKSGKYKYYRNFEYSGCYVECDKYFKNGEIRRDSDNSLILTIQNRKIFRDGEFDGRTVNIDGYIYNADAQYNLRSIVSLLQADINKRLSAEGVSQSNQLKWTLGYYDVETDKEFRRLINENVTYKYGAFR